MSSESSSYYTTAKEHYKNATALNEIAQEWMKQANASMNQYRNAILEGEETTGDPLKDILIVRHKFEAEKFEDRYQGLLEKMQGKNGEMVLRVEHNVVNFPHFSNMRDASHESKIIKTSYGLGLLNGESLVLNLNISDKRELRHFGGDFETQIAFPTDGFFAKVTDPIFHTEHKGFVHERLSADATNIDTPLEEAAWHVIMATKPEFKTELIIGNHNVNLWMAARRDKTLASLTSELNQRQLI